MSTSTSDRSRRFGGVARLLGEAGLSLLGQSHAVVIGLGGVGSWAAEALARCGVGRLTLIDMDHIAESNINRQIHALQATLGAAKVQAMTDRIAAISHDTVVEAVDEFITPENVLACVPASASVVIDAIDAPRAKAALAALCVSRAQPLVVCGAAGGRLDPLALAREDLAQVRGDPLIASVRSRLRRDYGFSRQPGDRFGLPVIHCARGVAAAPVVGAVPARGESGAALACAGYGSIVTVTAAMGMAAAAHALDLTLAARKARGGG